MDELSLITDWEKFKVLAEKLAEDGYIPLYGEFCRDIEEIVLNSIHTIKDSGKTTATILINSQGGDDRTYCAIVSAMNNSELAFTGIVSGYAESNAAYLLQRCKVRKAYLMSTIMLHWGGYTLNNRQVAALLMHDLWPVEDICTFFKSEVPFILKRTGMSEEEFFKIAGDERVLPASTALKMGLIDEIIDKLPEEEK